MTDLEAANPFATESTLPFRLPDFGAISPDHFRAGFDAGMARQLEALDVVAADESPATAANVLEAWERSGALLDRVAAAFFTVQSANTTAELDDIYATYLPRLAEHSDRIWLNRALYDRLTALETRAAAGEVTLDEQATWALQERLRSFRRAGVTLQEADQARLRVLNTRLAELGAEFNRRNREARNAGAIVLPDATRLGGLSPDEVAALAAGDGTYRIELVNTTRQPLMAKLHDRTLRRQLFEASASRASSGDLDTRQLVVDIARLRAERANLLGYENHAALVVEQGCAKTVAAVEELMVPLALAARRQAAAEASEFAARFASIAPGTPFEAWDWEYVAELVRHERYAIDEEGLGTFLEPRRVLDAVYGAAHDLYGITFRQRPDLVGHTPDAEVYEVLDADASSIGLFVMDFWASPAKEGGAWMTSVVDQSQLLQTAPVVTNNCNYTRTQKAISWDDVITMFHEFGHALHGLFADSRYPSFSGTSTPRDFVELPSQVNEHWAWAPGRVVPAEWADRLRAAERFNIGFEQSEQLQATLLDWAWHTTPLDELPVTADEVPAFESSALARWGIADPLVPPRYRSQYFAHIWGSGYAASYYGYKWAEVMDADAVAWFEEHGGATRDNGDWFRRTLLAPGGSVDALETYRRFRGRDPQVGPLLSRLGFEL